MSESVEDFNRKITVLVIGAPACGKTSFVNRAIWDTFQHDIDLTVVVDYNQVTIDWDEKTRIKVTFWDIGGQDQNAILMKNYIRGVNGAFIFYDLSRPETFDRVDLWLQAVNEMIETLRLNQIPIVLIGNKQDIAGGVESPWKYPKYLRQYCDEKGLSGFQVISVKDNYKVQAALYQMIDKCLESMNQELPGREIDPDIRRLGANDPNDEEKRWYFCYLL